MLLRSNINLEFIDDRFFQHLHGLQVLDLSRTCIQQLPNSVSDLLNLTSLLLRRCRSLKVIPSLAKLRRLKKLDMSYSGIKELPEGMNFLYNLNYLNLYRSEISELPNGLLANFSGLQFLKFDEFINGEELVTLRKLEKLVCCFNDITNFITYTESTNQCSNYRLSLGSQTDLFDIISIDRTVRLIYCNLVNESRDAIYLPSNIQNLDVVSCYGRTLRLKNESGLKGLFVWNCKEMEYLTCSSSSNDEFQSLMALKISRVPSSTASTHRRMPLPSCYTRNSTNHSCKMSQTLFENHPLLCLIVVKCHCRLSSSQHKHHRVRFSLIGAPSHQPVSEMKLKTILPTATTLSY